MKMRRAGFRAPWLSHQAARAAATSGRFCSAARSDFFEPQAAAIERAPQATEADRHPALGCQPITQFRERRVGLRTQARQQRLLMARELAGRASVRHPRRRLARPPATDESFVDVRNADPQQRGNLPHRHATIHRRQNPQAQVVRIRHPHCGPLGPNQTETPGITNFALRESLADSAQSKTALGRGQNR